jgi:hypothetical protein
LEDKRERERETLKFRNVRAYALINMLTTIAVIT